MAARVADKGGVIMQQGAVAAIRGTIEKCNYRPENDQRGANLWVLVAFTSSNPKAQYPDRLSLIAFGKKADEYGPIVGEGLAIEASCSIRPRTIKQDDGSRLYVCEFVIDTLRTEHDQCEPRNERKSPKVAPQRPRPGPRAPEPPACDDDPNADVPF